MNPIAKLSDKELLINIKFLVSEEKRIVQEVLNHLEEIEIRKLYLSRGYPSLSSTALKSLAIQKDQQTEGFQP